MENKNAVDQIPWEKIHTLVVYDTNLVRVKRKSEIIENSIIDISTGKKYMPELNFQKDIGDEFVRVEGKLNYITEYLTAETQDRTIQNRSVMYKQTNQRDVRHIVVITKIPKVAFADMLSKCIETDSVLWEDKRFKEVLELSIKNLACDLTSYTGMLLIYKNKNYIFSESIGKILSKENTLAGKFSGIFLKENSLTIPKILFNDSIHRLKNCTLIYEENNMKFVIEGKYLKKNSDGFYNVDLALIHFEKLDSRIECKFTEGSYSVLINKELNMPNNKFENRLVLLNVPHEKQNIENRVTITANGSMNRFNKLRI